MSYLGNWATPTLLGIRAYCSRVKVSGHALLVQLQQFQRADVFVLVRVCIFPLNFF